MINSIEDALRQMREMRTVFLLTMWDVAAELQDRGDVEGAVRLRLRLREFEDQFPQQQTVA